MTLDDIHKEAVAIQARLVQLKTLAYKIYENSAIGSDEEADADAVCEYLLKAANCLPFEE